MPYGRFNGFDCSDCETNWLIGRNGTCDEENEICICPPGFSGKDDFVVTQTCHINESAVTNYHRLIVAVCTISFMVNFISLILLYRRPLPSKTEETKVYEVVQLTKLSIVFALIYIGFFGASSALYAFSGKRVSFEDYEYALPILGGSSVIFLGITYNLMFLTWYKSIPDPEEYGKMLNYPEFVTKYPNFVPKLCIGASCLWTLLTIIGFFILPYVSDDQDFGQTSASFFIFSLPFGLIVYAVITIMTLTSVKRLYKAALEAAEISIPESDQTTSTTVVNSGLAQNLHRIKAVMQTIYWFKIVLGSAIGLSLCLATTHILIGGIYQYIFFTGPALVITIASIFSPILTLRNTVSIVISLFILEWRNVAKTYFNQINENKIKKYV